MEWSTHALSGMVAGYVVTGGEWRGAVVGGVAAVIPDLDEHKSKFGKIFFPISFSINKIFGHRTITHSLLFAFLICGLLYFFTDSWVWLSSFAGIIAHILGDMVTGTVQLFYPIKKSVGLRIHPIYFTPIDRIVRVLLIVYVIFAVTNF